jgi:hypothetical protein
VLRMGFLLSLVGSRISVDGVVRPEKAAENSLGASSPLPREIWCCNLAGKAIPPTARFSVVERLMGFPAGK